jgi:hypothetical protein
LYRRQQQPRQHADDGNHHQHFGQGESRTQRKALRFGKGFCIPHDCNPFVLVEFVKIAIRGDRI